MPIRFACSCGKSLQVSDEAAGKRAKCPACGKVLVIPAARVPGKKAAAAPPEEPADGITAAGTRRRTPRDLVPEEEARPRRTRKQLTPNEEDEEEPRPRRKRETEDEEDEAPLPGRRKRSSPTLLIVGVAAGAVLLLAGGGGLAYWLLSKDGNKLAQKQAPAEGGQVAQEQGPTEDDQRASAKKLMQMGQAMQNYHDSNGRFPPHAIYSQNGKPLLSWRVAILPFLDESDLYKQFHLDEPWDSPHNKALLPRMPKAYAAPGVSTAQPGMTYYQAFVGKGAVFEDNLKISLLSITDGTANTLMLAEAAKPVPWTKPEDLAFNPDGPLPRLGGPYPDGFNAAFADGSVHWIKKGIPAQTLKALITRNGGEKVAGDW